MATEKVLFLWYLDGSGNYCLCSSHSDVSRERTVCGETENEGCEMQLRHRIMQHALRLELSPQTWCSIFAAAGSQATTLCCLCRITADCHNLLCKHCEYLCLLVCLLLDRLSLSEPRFKELLNQATNNFLLMYVFIYEARFIIGFLKTARISILCLKEHQIQLNFIFWSRPSFA